MGQHGVLLSPVNDVSHIPNDPRMLPTAVILVLIDNNYSSNLSREHSGAIASIQTIIYRDGLPFSFLSWEAL